MKALWGQTVLPEDAFDAKAVEPTGHLSITAPVLFGQIYVAPAVTRFVERHPGVR
jgi:DNA-binding transcriptional LysR family regulator